MTEYTEKFDLVLYYNRKNVENGIISDFIFVPEDENFLNNVKSFEKNIFFLEWSKVSKKIINEKLK